jgi:hypothetical protein
VLAAAAEGDELAFGVLWRDLQPALLRHLNALDPGAGEDLASETWLRAEVAVSGTGELRPAAAPVTGGPAPALPSGGDRPTVRHGRRIASPGGDPGHEPRLDGHGQPSRARPPRAGKDKPSKARPPKGEPSKGQCPQARVGRGRTRRVREPGWRAEVGDRPDTKGWAQPPDALVIGGRRRDAVQA